MKKSVFVEIPKRALESGLILRNFCGRPLIFWALFSLESSDLKQITLLTTSFEVQSAVQKFRFKKVSLNEGKASKGSLVFDGSNPFLRVDQKKNSDFGGISIKYLDENTWLAAEVLFKQHFSDVLAKAHKKASTQIKLFLTDVDGVLTDAGMYYSENGDELKKFCTHDGMAMRFIQTRLGIKVGIVTTENRKLNERRSEKLKLDFLRQGVNNKLEEVESICKHLNISMSEVAFIGDDVNDEKILSKVGFAACPANALPRIKRLPNVVLLSKAGGFGAVREWAEYLFGEVEWS
jgi:YrbI family 3-deoxy-D-manno-octulosonate 8-phosphate phosphatase